MNINQETLIRVKRILVKTANNDSHKESIKAQTMLKILNTRIINSQQMPNLN